jgi:hypothetical protein
MGNSAVQAVSMGKKWDALKLGKQEAASIPTFINNLEFMWHSGWAKITFPSGEREAPRKERSHMHRMQNILLNNQTAIKTSRE